MNKSSVKLSILAFFFLMSSTIKSQDIFDMCSQITSAYQTNATDTSCASFVPIRIEGNFNNATPEIEISDCLSANSPTVWMKVKVDENAEKLGTSGKARNIENNIVWSIYYGSCGDLKILNGGTISDPCACSHCDKQDEIHVVGLINGITEYYIAVSLDGDIALDEGFDFNIWTTTDCISCIGEDGCVPLADFSITRRSSDRPLDDPTFCPEEEVTVCIDYTYDASETGVDWLHGLIPNFGNGWDMSSFNPNDVDFSPSLAEWSVADASPCAPFITENMPYLCTYVDSITGVLKLCHTGCQTCPCVGPLEAGAPLPSGWFFNSNGGEGCANDCSPSSHWGIGQVVVNINFCMDLKVQSIENIENGKADRNLQISFQTTSDGVSGCWEDPVAECVLDFAQIGPRWKINTSTSYLSAPNDTSIVEGNPLSLEISLNNNLPSNDDIYIDYEPNPYVLGMQKDTFENGMGIITDVLTNITDSLQVVKYVISSQNETNDKCGNIDRKILVYVYPTASYVPVTVTTLAKIYPNPGQNQVTIELKDDVIKDAQIAALTDTKGNHWPVVSSRISDNMHSLDTANMPQGVYVIYILDGNGTKYMVKWIKI